MTARALPRATRRTRASTNIAAFLIRLPLNFIWFLITLFVREGAPRRKYDGNVGSDESLKRYGDLTQAEHDEIGGNG